MFAPLCCPVGDLVPARADGADGGLVDDGGQLGADEALGLAGRVAEVDVGGHGDAVRVDAEDLLAAQEVGRGDLDDAVEAARADEGGVEDGEAVRRGEDDDAVVGNDAVHAREELVERLLDLVVRAWAGRG